MRLDFRSERRGYTLEINEDLFGAFILRRHWYGLSNRRGGSKQQVFLSEADALGEVRRIVRTREKHGYTVPAITQKPGLSRRESPQKTEKIVY